MAAAGDGGLHDGAGLHDDLIRAGRIPVQRGKVAIMSDINKHHPMTDHGVSAEMPRYVSHKKVWALEIESVSTDPDRDEKRILTFRDKGYAPMEADDEMFSRYQPVAGDFYVVYADGYKSFSPRKAFLEGYKATAV